MIIIMVLSLDPVSSRSLAANSSGTDGPDALMAALLFCQYTRGLCQLPRSQLETARPGVAELVELKAAQLQRFLSVSVDDRDIYGHVSQKGGLQWDWGIPYPGLYPMTGLGTKFFAPSRIPD